MFPLGGEDPKYPVPEGALQEGLLFCRQQDCKLQDCKLQHPHVIMSSYLQKMKIMIWLT